MPELAVTDSAARDDLGAFVASAVWLERDCVVRLRQQASELVDAWAATPFDVLATRTVIAEVTPADVTVSGNELLAALAVARGARMDPGPVRDLFWRSPLPPTHGWQQVDELPSPELADLADRGIALARDSAGPRGTLPDSMLDQSVLTITGSGFAVRIPLRCLLALSGMGFLSTAGTTGEADTGETVRVSATDTWLRMDARFGAVVCRRHALLPLLV